MSLTLLRWLISLLVPITYSLGGDVTVSAEPHPLGARTTFPLLFEPNRGQAEPGIDFLVRGLGYNMYLNRSELTIASPRKRPSRSTESVQFDVIRMKLAGSLPGATGVASEEAGARINYVTGHRPADWILGVPAYQRVKFASIYRGIDVVYYARGQRFEYDFVVHPGSETRAIRLAFQGARDIRLDSSGDLVMTTESREVRHLKPVAYQEIDGVRRPVGSRYRLHEDGTAGFDLDEYDTRYELIIDPVLTVKYSTYLGGSSNDLIYGVAVNALGQAHVAGATSSPNFPIVAGDPGNGVDRAFVAKFSADGSQLIYSTIIGASTGTGRTIASAIALDASGNSHITGQSTVPANQFPLVGGSSAWWGTGANAIYVKLDQSGAPMISTLFGGNGNENGSSIAVNSSGAATIAGSYVRTPNVAPTGDLPVTSNAYQSTFRGGTSSEPSDGFVTRFSASGSSLEYSSYLGGAGNDYAVGVAVDSSNNVIVAGSTDSLDFPTLKAEYKNYRGGPSDAFVTKINGSTGGLTYSTYLGGSGFDYGTAVAVNSSGNAYVTGSTLSTNFPVKKAFQSSTASITDFDAYVTCLSPAGAMVYSTYLGGNGPDSGLAIAVDDSGAAYVAGVTTPGGPVSTFPLLGVPDYTAQDLDGFLTKFAPTGSTLLASMLLGGAWAEEAYAVATNKKGTVWAAGVSYSDDFPTTPGSYQPVRAPGQTPAIQEGWLTSVTFPNTLVSFDFRKPAIAQNRYVWFNANVELSGVPPTGAVVRMEDAAVEFTANNTFYRIPVPNAEIVVTAVTCASTVFQSGKWVTTVPITAKPVFMAGVTFSAALGLPGDLEPVNWSGRITSSVPGITAEWRWGAAVYTSFAADYNALQVKAANGNGDCTSTNSGKAGTPEAYKQYLVSGGTGPGGSHYTGKFSPLESVEPDQQ